MLKKFVTSVLLFFAFTTTTSAQLAIDLPEKQNTYSLNPGSVTELEINLRNSYRTPATIAVYTVDGTSTSSGTVAAKQFGEEHFFFGQWAKINVDEITLDGQESKPVTLTITIPENATPGDYAGAIVVSRITPPEERTAETTTTTTGAGLNFATRLAKTVFINIPGEKTSAANIGNMSYKDISGNQYKLYTELENAGNTTLRFVQETQITSFMGEIKDLPAKETQLFPVSKANGEINLGSLPILESYKVKQKISYYEKDIITGEETFIETVERSLEITIIPWGYIILGLAILLLLIFAVFYKRISNKKLLKSCKKYTIKSGDTLMNIADKAGVNWKKIAKINNINPPYELKTGNNILVPDKK